MYVAIHFDSHEFEYAALIFDLKSLVSKAASMEAGVYLMNCAPASWGWTTGLRGAIQYCASLESISVQRESVDHQNDVQYIAISKNIDIGLNEVVEYRSSVDSMVDG